MKEIHTLTSKFLNQLNKVKTYKPDRLFDIEADWKQLIDYRCPYCGKKLLIPLYRNVALCNKKKCPSKKGKDYFRVHKDKLEEIRGKILTK